MLRKLIQLSLDTHLEAQENTDNTGVLGFLFRFCKLRDKTHESKYSHAEILGMESVLSLSLRTLGQSESHAVPERHITISFFSF